MPHLFSPTQFAQARPTAEASVPNENSAARKPLAQDVSDEFDWSTTVLVSSDLAPRLINPMSEAERADELTFGGDWAVPIGRERLGSIA